MDFKKNGMDDLCNAVDFGLLFIVLGIVAMKKKWTFVRRYNSFK